MRGGGGGFFFLRNARIFFFRIPVENKKFSLARVAYADRITVFMTLRHYLLLKIFFFNFSSVTCIFGLF